MRDKLTKSESYALGVTERRVVEQSGSDDNPELEPTFAYCNFLKFFEEWIAYRIELEVSYLKHFMAKAEFVCKILRGKIKVCASADALDRAIKIIRTAKEPKASLMKEFKLDEDQVEAILSMQLRSLAKLALADVKSQLAAVEEELAGYAQRLKAPASLRLTICPNGSKPTYRNLTLHKVMYPSLLTTMTSDTERNKICKR